MNTNSYSLYFMPIIPSGIISCANELTIVVYASVKVWLVNKDALLTFNIN